MPWYFPWSESIKKRACRYLLQYYLGRFLDRKLELDQLSVDLYKGTGSVKDVELDVEALNQVCDEQNIPIEIINGCISEVTVSVPWSNLLNDSSFVEIQGLYLTIHPKHQSKNGFTWESMINSMSMTTSLQLAEECLKQENDDIDGETQPGFEGLEMFAKTLETVLARVKVRLLNTIFRLECLPNGSVSGIGLEVHISKIDYFDMAGLEQSSVSGQPTMIERTSYATKKFLMEGVTVHTDEFSMDSELSMRNSTRQDTDPTRSRAESSFDSSSEGIQANETLILCGKLYGRHELSVHMKISDVVLGPKVELDLIFGSSVFFLSPRQLHSLAFLVDWFLQPTVDNKRLRVKQTEKPMQPSDYKKIESELLHHLQYSNTPKVQGEFLSRKGWSSGVLDISCEDEDFHPFSEVSKHSNFRTSTSSDSPEKCIPPENEQLFDDIHENSTGLKFNMKVGGVVAVLLHEDILTCNSSNGGRLVESTVTGMKMMAENFFSQTGLLTFSGMGTKGYKTSKEHIQKACSRNHLQVILAPIIFSGTQEDYPGGFKFDYHLSVGFAEIAECLTDTASDVSHKFNSYPVLSFVSSEHESSSIPNIIVKVSSGHPSRLSQARGFNPVKTGPMFHIQLTPCNIELDISVVDRVTALINRPAFLNSNKTKICQMYRDNTKGVDALLNDSIQHQTCINISSSLMNLRMRFPIPDLRPFHDPQRTPWWHRYLRPDILTLQLHDASIVSNYIPNETVSIYEMQCKKLSCLYRDGQVQKDDVTFMLAGAQDGDVVDIEDGAGHYDLPRLVLTLRPYGDHLEEQETLHNEGNILEEELDAMNFSTGETAFKSNKSEPSPFTKQRRVRGAEISGEADTNLEELLIPGSAEDITKFISFSSRNCSYQVDVSLPKVEFTLPSKQFYENLYNRLSTDLCLWEPSAPMFTAIPQKKFFEEHHSTAYAGLGAASLHTAAPSPGFIMCKSGVAYDSDSESESDGNGDFHSVCGISEHSKSKEIPSKLCISVMIGQASGTVICDLKDSSGENSKLHHGQLTVSLVNGKLFSVTAFKGDPLLGYVSFRASKAEVYHNGCVMNPAEFPFQSFQGNTEDQVIYPSERLRTNGKNCATPMLSVVVEIKTDSRSDVKKFKTAVAVENGTLRHRFCPAEQTWLTQIIDFFDVIDHPVAGYKPPKVVTELHSNFVNCGIDYRPLNFPAKVYMSIGALNISSNIVAQTKSSLLRFIVEDLSLHLSNRPSMERIPSIDSDYVCVLEVDLAELSLRIQEAHEKTGSELKKSDPLPPQSRPPNIDLEAMVNVLHLRTCADSCRLLLDLITYLADDGDLDETGMTISDDVSDCNVVGIDCDISRKNDTNEKQLDAQVCNLMADAMIDSSPTSVHQAVNKDSSTFDSLKCQTEVFFFPDESAILKRNKVIRREEHPLCNSLQKSITLNLRNATLSQPSDEGDNSSLEEDFCILGNDPGVGIRPRGGEPTIRQLNSIVQMVEGHFSPPFGKSDVLKAPKHFPRPVVRYALRDMNLIWEIYGGQDFSCQEPSLKKKPLMKTVSFAKGQDNQASVKISSKADESAFIQSNHTAFKKENKKRSTKGGIGRLEEVKLELQMSKVRLVHDVYPDSAVQASRQVLSIGEIEIRDRLAQSHINKLLYQYCSEARPRQSHANMVLIKALHVRPDLTHGSTQECCLKVSILPLRLHLDQDTLTFISEFFGSIASSGTCSNGQEVDKVNNFTPVPVMNVATESNGIRPESSDTSASPDASESSVAQPVYFRSFTFSPDVLIRFDYHGKGVDLSQGPSLSGLLAGLGQLNCSQLTLKRMSNRHGLLGVNKLAAYAINEWIMDIKKNQLPSVMAGVGPMHSIVQLGIRDLFWLPIEQFQRDGRIVRGLQRGANAFSTSAAFAILELTSRMIQTLQTAAETAYDVVSPGPSVKRSKPGSRGRRRRHTQPTDIRDGVAKAYQVVKEGLGETAQNLVRVASEEAEQKGVTGAVGGVLRQIPPIVVKPIILATEATVNVIGGVQSQLVPDTRKEAIDKWRQDD